MSDDVREGRFVELPKGTLVREDGDDERPLRAQITVLVELVEDGRIFWSKWGIEKGRSAAVADARPSYLNDRKPGAFK